MEKELEIDLLPFVCELPNFKPYDVYMMASGELFLWIWKNKFQ